MNHTARPRKSRSRSLHGLTIEADFFDGKLTIRQLAESLVADQSAVANIRLRGRRPRDEFERRRKRVESRDYGAVYRQYKGLKMAVYKHFVT